ncbi:unnamed protein product [Phytophthora lilii]|uniref:Unnamed protein product n=1 Tax=Phytophthora lilii TaxID=2077276 RepID=A0A9W6X4I1_9STRA|nr:unnamed protein product [Phytophthora lilii]
MMQHAKLMSAVGLDMAKQEIHKALRGLEASPHDSQSVYTSLTSVFNVVVDHPQAELAVDSTLATQKNVQILRALIRMHLREEEMQWTLGRVISLASRASIRFQCQAGQLEMWNALFDMRSAHPQSIRVLEASLQATETLFRSNEFHVVKFRPQQLLGDLIGIMDRFLRVQTPQRRAHKLVVLALRVLVALYSSPRPTGLLLFSGESPIEGTKWACEITKRMVDSFTVFNRYVDSVGAWLNMALLLLRQHPVQALDNLFSPAPAREITWWFILVVERWQAQTKVMNSLFATLSHIFALPHNTLGDEIQVSLADKLFREQSLLDLLCEVIDRYHTKVSASDSLPYDAMLVLLEAIRVVRQWSERPTLLARFKASRSVKATLLLVLIEQLHSTTKQSPTSPLSRKRLVFVLEILLVLRRLATSSTLRGVLAASDKLQLSLKWLCCKPSDGDTIAIMHEDGDLPALVAREARAVLNLLAPTQEAAATSTAIVVTKAVAAPRKLQKATLVRPETLRAYANGAR